MLAATASAAEGFSFEDKAGEHLDVLLDGKIVARYMYAHDVSTPAQRDLTYKPYLHVYDADGKAPITKGPGGQFPHHRGIFIGWMKMAFNGKSYDRWHMKGGDIVHEKFLTQKADKDQATFTSLTHWLAEDGKSIVDEERTTTIRRAKAPARLLFDTTFKLTAPNGDVTLDGDPEHAGVQFRPSNDVVGKETVYYFPKEKADPTKDVDYPWVGETFTLNGKKHSAVIFNLPGNPAKTRFSAYRDYGRFGAFPVAKIEKEKSITFHYAFLIADGEIPGADYIQKAWDEAAEVKTATPTPTVTEIHAKVPAKK